MRHRTVWSILGALTLFGGAPAWAVCAGDCDSSNTVGVAELVRCVRIADGAAPLSECPACDDDADQTVRINDVIAGVGAALGGCRDVDGFEPDDTPAEAAPIACGDIQPRRFAPAGDQDWVILDLPANTGVVIQTLPGPPTLDTALTLFNQDQVQLSFDDNSGGSGYSRISRPCGVNALPAGRYFIRATNLSTTEANYGLGTTCSVCSTPTITRTPTITPTPLPGPDEFEPDNGLADAKPLVCGETQRRTFTANDYTDWMTIAVAERSTVHVRVRPRLNYLNSVQLFDAQGHEIYSDLTWDCGSDAIEPGERYSLVASGPIGTVYDVSMACQPCGEPNPTITATPTVTATWSPTASPTPPTEDDYEPDDREHPVRVSCGDYLLRSLVPRRDTDWLQLEVPERSSVWIDTYPYSGVQIALQDSNGTDIAFGYTNLYRECGGYYGGPLDAGTYLIELYPGQGSLPFPYDLWVNCEPCSGPVGSPTVAVPTRVPTPTPMVPDGYEPDDTLQTATAIDCGSLQIHSFSDPIDEDWVEFILEHESAVVASAAGRYGYPLALFAGDGSYVTDGYTSINRACGSNALPAGRYYLRSGGNFGQSDLSYNFSLLCQPCEAQSLTPSPTPTPP